jgi:FdhD protein
VAHPINRVARRAWRANDFSEGDRAIPEETAIAFTYNGTSYAVMMATPQDLEDFACGFSLTEGIVSSLDEIEELDIVEGEIGIELRMWLAEPQSAAFGERRRRLAGPTGCGLCGIESLSEACRPPPIVPDGQLFTPRDIMRAIESIGPSQTLNRETRAVAWRGVLAALLRPCRHARGRRASQRARQDRRRGRARPRRWPRRRSC